MFLRGLSFSKLGIPSSQVPSSGQGLSQSCSRVALPSPGKEGAASARNSFIIPAPPGSWAAWNGGNLYSMAQLLPWLREDLKTILKPLKPRLQLCLRSTHPAAFFRGLFLLLHYTVFSFSYLKSTWGDESLNFISVELAWFCFFFFFLLHLVVHKNPSCSSPECPHTALSSFSDFPQLLRERK